MKVYSIELPFVNVMQTSINPITSARTGVKLARLKGFSLNFYPSMLAT